MIRTDHFLELFGLVKKHMAWDDDKTAFWFDTPNPHIGGVAPRLFWKIRPEKCERWIKSLIEENTPPEVK